MLTAFVLARHGYIERARILVESLLALGEEGHDVQLARCVLRFLEKDYASALSGLDRLEAETRSKAPVADQPGSASMQHYLRARCLCETGRRPEGEAIARELSNKNSKFTA